MANRADDERVSLHPLGTEEALEALLSTPPPPADLRHDDKAFFEYVRSRPGYQRYMSGESKPEAFDADEWRRELGLTADDD